MKTISFLILCIFAIRVSAKELPCPPKLETNQVLAKNISSWKTFQDSNDVHILQSVDFYDGDPKEMAQLAPDNADSKNDPVWTFGVKSEIWQVCRYTNTKISLTKNLGRSFKSCAVKFNKKIDSQVDSISCK